MDPLSLVLLFAAAGIVAWLWHLNSRVRAILRDRRAALTGGASAAAGDTGGQGLGVDGGFCGMDGGGSGHC